VSTKSAVDRKGTIGDCGGSIKIVAGSPVISFLSLAAARSLFQEMGNKAEREEECSRREVKVWKGGEKGKRRRLKGRREWSLKMEGGFLNNRLRR